MIADTNFFGVFINGGLISAVAGLLLLWPLRRILIAADLYRFVWHPPLFDLALFVVAWGGVAFAIATWPTMFAFLLG